MNRYSLFGNRYKKQHRRSRECCLFSIHSRKELPVDIARHWNLQEDKIIQCTLCPHTCRIPEGKRGICKARENQNGVLYAVYYGWISSAAIDPIEKKPLDYFYPGANILSLGGYGCNFHCGFCQNHHISLEYEHTEGQLMDVDEVLYIAQAYAISKGNIGIAYTFNEPLINYEFVYDCARQASAEGFNNVLVTNGYINGNALDELLPYIDAMNIDLKAFTPEFYQRVGGDLESVKNTIIKASDKCHVEVTTLVIEGENDKDIPAIAKWLADINPEIPYHLSRFYPRYNFLDKPPTDVRTIARLADEASKYLSRVCI